MTRRGRRVRASLASALAACASLAPAAPAATPTAESQVARVIVLANRDDPESLRVARHYAAARNVPAANIIALPLPRTEAITWPEFVATLWRPLVARLVAATWIEATPMELTDAVGRRKYAPYRHRIAALVVCRGVPVKVAHDASLWVDTPPFTRRAEFRTNAGAVDSELSLLALPNYAINGFVPNPLFQNDRPTAFERGQVVPVARLDGPTVEDALALVDRAIEAERTGLQGRAYLDLSDRDPIGNAWLESASAQLEAAGFDVVLDRAAATLPATARVDAPAIYMGWYAADLDGPFALPGFRFPPGAIALHIHSFSAATLRSPSAGWVGPLVARGATATFGNVHEPYLQLTHRPDLLLRALLRGETLADAACYALNALSWQAIAIGDPLYRPFALTLEQQIAELTAVAPERAGYAVLRQVRQLERAGRAGDALALALARQRDVRSLALSYEIVRRQRAAGKAGAAADALRVFAERTAFATTEWGLARDAAALLLDAGDARGATAIWRALLGTPTLPRDLRVVWLPLALPAAAAAGEHPLETEWRREFAGLTADEKGRVR